MTPEAAIDRLCSAAFSNLRKHTWFHRMERDEQDELVTIITVAITETRASALRVPANHVRDENGVDMRVLGTLPKTLDHCVVGIGANVMYPMGDGTVWTEIVGFANLMCEPIDVTSCWGNRDVALAAKEKA